MASAPKRMVVAPVREIVEFVLRSGDLAGERDFVGPSRALAGIRGHQAVQRSRPDGYKKEVRVSWDWEETEFILRIQGRIDGVLVTGQGALIEEIKTVERGWDGQADPLHWAQAKFYGCIYAREHGLGKVTIRLAYLDLETGALKEFADDFARDELSSFFDQTTAVYAEWIRAQQDWRQLRDRSIQSLRFPFVQYRPGQRELAVRTYRSVVAGERHFIEAPTGIGKTISVLFAAVKALGQGEVDRLFYLTARTVGRVVAEKAISDLRRGQLRLRSLTLTAKEKLCVRDGEACDPGTCPLAVGYYDRRKAAMRQALAREEITRPVLEEVSREHQVCPFELGLDLSLWTDVVICDYNYAFDPRAYLRRHFAEEKDGYVLLVDEAHNLVDRAREMFSAEIDGRDIRQLSRSAASAAPKCSKALARLASALRKLARAGGPPLPAEEEAELELALLKPGPTPPGSSALLGVATPIAGDAQARRAFPAELMPVLEAALKETETWLARGEAADFRAGLLELYFRLHSFSCTAEQYDERFRTIIQGAPAPRVKLYCLDPSLLLRETMERGKAAVLFSATLTPLEYYRDLLGGSDQDPCLRLSSPFPPEHLAVLVQDGIPTHFRARDETLTAVAESIGTLVGGRRGNYLVYLPSYQYLKAVHEEFRRLFPATALIVQRPEMSEPERDSFLASFVSGRDETLVGFAVMGGVFGEGIDLVGDRLIGAVVVGVGLPQLCLERDLIRDHFQERLGNGFEYAYTFPGINRVFQATGRVIRSETDRGVVLFIDTRFGQRRYRQLFPAWWRPVRVRGAEELRTALAQFWENAD